MTAQRLDPGRALRRAAHGARRAARRVHGGRPRRAAARSSPRCWAGSSDCAIARRRRRSRRGDGLEALRRRDALVQPGRARRRCTRCSDCRAAAAEPRPPARGRGPLGVQHRDQLRHQHQLAGLRRRIHHEHAHADARALPCRTSSPRRPASRSWPPSSAGSRATNSSTVGNFWADLVRSTLYILLPLSLALALVLVVAGRAADVLARRCTPPASRPHAEPDGKPVTEQRIVLGPVASQIAIKQLGTNGGGYYNVNSAHPFENPTPLTNLVEVLAILAIAGGPVLHVRPHGGRHARQGWAVYAAMTVLFVAFLVFGLWAETRPGPAGGAGRRHARHGDAGRRRHGGQGGALWRRELRAVGHGHHERLQRLGQLHARLVHAARAASCPWRSCSWARWCTAASVPGSTACWCSRSSPCSWRASWWAARPSTWARRSSRSR